MLEAGDEIWQTPADEANSITYMARQLVQVTLPHRNPGNVPAWKRVNGNLMLRIRPGLDQNDESIGFPYGSVPRLVLFWLTREALRRRSRKLELGDTLAGFMREVGLNPYTGGGKRGDARRLRNQLERLFRATISFERTDEVGALKCKAWLDMQVAPAGEFWWDPMNPSQSSLFGSWIMLGESFYEAVLAHPVPVDMRALRALKQSPLALDLYAWLAYRTFRVAEGGKAQFVPWRGLRAQFGTDYSDLKNFKRKAKSAILKVQTVYPGLCISDIDGGLVIKPGRPAVAPQSRLAS